MTSSDPGRRARFRRRKLQTDILRYPQAASPHLINTRDMSQRHLSLRGSFDYHDGLSSLWLEHERTVIVYLPPSYARHTQRRYPVLYMHDGNNLFDPATGFMGREWRLDETLERLFDRQELAEMIVVGIYNTPARFEEYTCHPHNYGGISCGGRGHDYARFVVEELKPWIDSHYRTLKAAPYTAMMGSSLGAVISFYTALVYPDVFSRVGLMSPTVYWAGHQMLQDVVHFPRGLRLWVDIGSEEGSDPHSEETVESTQALVMALEQIGYRQPDNLGFYIDWLVGHDEWAWANRSDKALRYLFADLPA
ncbi:MAG: alpha/beta hydrolase [Candidatus Sericytochromatia bacterium]